VSPRLWPHGHLPIARGQIVLIVWVFNSEETFTNEALTVGNCHT